MSLKIDELLRAMVQSGASDMHLKAGNAPGFRVDGEMVPQEAFGPMAPAATADLARQLMSEEQWERFLEDKDIDFSYAVPDCARFRVNALHQRNSVGVVIRQIPDQIPDHKQLQLPQITLDLASKPRGLVLVTGPTGSGKSTTLYRGIEMINDGERKIITIEDPVEYELSGINQIPVNPKRGLTFASGLRSILRQDPDVVLVGEIRDNETADIAIRSALTGHLILSTLHTNDAISSIGRLVDMDAEPFLVASVLEGLLAQRLGRRICQHCREQIPLEEDMAQRLRTDERELFGGRAWRGAGCEKCNNTGYLGRLGYFELLRINPAMRAAITSSASQSELREAAGDDFSLMRQDGILRAVEGETTIEEVLRATQDSDEMVT